MAVGNGVSPSLRQTASHLKFEEHDQLAVMVNCSVQKDAARHRNGPLGSITNPDLKDDASGLRRFAGPLQNYWKRSLDK